MEEIIQQKLIWKNATGIETSNFALKLNLTSLETVVAKVDVDKLKTFPVDLKFLLLKA